MLGVVGGGGGGVRVCGRSDIRYGFSRTTAQIHPRRVTSSGPVLRRGAFSLGLVLLSGSPSLSRGMVFAIIYCGHGSVRASISVSTKVLQTAGVFPA